MTYFLLHTKGLNVVPIYTRLLSADILLHEDRSILLCHAVSNDSYRRFERRDLLGLLHIVVKALRSIVT